MNQVRHDIYGQIHKGLRRELCAWVGRFGQLNATDADEVSRAHSDFATFARLMRLHAEHEERWVHPMLDACAVGLVEQIESDHHELDELIGRVESGLRRLDESECSDAWALQSEIYQSYSRYCSRYLAHMEREETEALPALQAAHGDEELAAVTSSIRGAVPAARMAEFLMLMVPAMHLGERVGFFSEMKAHAPGEVYEGACALAAGVLGEAQWRLVKDGVAAA